MKTKGNWVIKYEDGFYYCGNNSFDKQLRKAQIYHWKEAAEESAESLRTRRYSKVADTKWEIVSVIPPQEQKEIEAHWIVAGTFGDFLKCSNCGESWPWATAAEFLFCPHCGKLMIKPTQED